MATSTKLSNVIGAPFPDFVLRQLAIRAFRNSTGRGAGSLASRTNEEVLFLANKTAWARLVSSVDLVLPGNTSINDFVTKLGIQGSGDFTENAAANSNYKTSNSLAKNWVLQSGTSTQNGNGINLRQGIGPNGAYGLGGTEELGYRPMPGLTSVTVETTGRLGSLRQATVNFKVWNMNQLNTIEALYFRLGYSMLLEWGHVQYFNNQDAKRLEVAQGVFVSKDVYGIEDPFAADLRKEDIQRRITVKRESTSGNYDGMLGIVTNFTWSLSQDGGYDCVVRLVGLGAIMDSMRVNQAYTLPAGTIKQFKGAESALDAYVAQQVALLKKQIADLKASGLGGGAAQQPVGEVPKTREELKEKLTTYDGYGGTTDQLFSTYGVPSFRDVLGSNNYYDYFGTFTQGGSYALTQAAQQKFGGLYLASRLGGSSNLVYIPNPTGTGFVNITLDAAVLKAFANNVQVQDYEPGDLGARKGVTKPKTNLVFQPVNTSVFGLDFAKPFSNTTLLASIVGYLTAIKTEIVPTFTGRAVTKKYTYVQPNEPVPEQFTVVGPTGVYKDEITVELSLPYAGTGRKDVYLTLGYEIANSNKDFLVSREELIQELSIWSRNPTLELTSLSFTKNKPDITITGKTILQVRSVYKGPATDNAGVPITPDRLVALGGGIYRLNSTTALNIPVTITLKTNNPGFISGVAKVTTPPPTGGGGGGGNVNTGTSNTTVQPASTDQVDSSMGFSSALHAMLTVVQTLSQANSIQKGNTKSKIVTYDLTAITKDFYQAGIFKDVIGPEVAIDPTNPTFNLTAFAQKGFATELMTNYDKFAQIPYIGGSTDPNQNKLDFSKLLTSFVFKYKQDNIDGYIYPSQFPVYISLGYLLSFINNMCLFYDSKTEQSNTNQTGGNDNRPYVYIDFNPETNFCLTSPQQFSIDPLICIIPANLTQDQYLQIFPPSILPSKPFDPSTQNAVSDALIKKGFSFKGGDSYQGKTMNIMLTTQYLLRTLRDFTTADREHAVNLHPFLERIMMDVNKCLGGVNLFRVAYRDDTNTIQIQDDQFVPALAGESTAVERDTFITNLKNQAILSGQLPIFGTVLPGPNGTSVSIPSLGIARDMQFKTVMSTKMASMIAISAQAYTGSVNAKDHSELSYLNRNYRDRFKPYVKDQSNGQAGSNTNATATTGTSPQKQNTSQPVSNDQQAADRFNTHVKSIYTNLELVVDKIDSSKNYYIERMSKVKSGDILTSAAPFIPAELELTLDGISGIVMGNAFIIPKERLPLSLKNEIDTISPDGLPKVAFIVNGLTHTIESNQWLTRVKGQMIKLRQQSTLGTIVTVPAGTQAGLAAFTGQLATEAAAGGGGGSTNSNANDPNSPCYVRPFVPQPGRVSTLPAAGKKRDGILTWRNAFPSGQTKGLKALIEAQTLVEGFYPAFGGKAASASWRSNNPGNIGTNTQVGRVATYKTLTEGVQAQIGQIQKIISGNSKYYPADSTLYQYLSIYAPPCYRAPNSTNVFLPSTNDPIGYTNSVIAYLKGEYGLDVTADMTLAQIISMN